MKQNIKALLTLKRGRGVSVKVVFAIYQSYMHIFSVKSITFLRGEKSYMWSQDEDISL